MRQLATPLGGRLQRKPSVWLEPLPLRMPDAYLTHSRNDGPCRIVRWDGDVGLQGGAGRRAGGVTCNAQEYVAGTDYRRQ